MSAAAILWRRLDTPGHDAGRLESTDDGWCLRGTAVFRHGELPARLDYRVTCDHAWRTREGTVQGWVGAEAIALAVARGEGGRWTLNGAPVPDLSDCVDVDFGFTPATNLLQLRRVALGIGQAADVPVAWLDVLESTLSRLDQRYERRAAGSYEYESPRFGYRAVLEVDAVGFARHYPGLWTAES
jgi:uncharacterized protein